MSDELYEGLREIYEDFFSQKNAAEEEKEKITNDNDYQYYERKIEDLDNKIKVVSSLLFLKDKVSLKNMVRIII